MFKNREESSSYCQILQEELSVHWEIGEIFEFTAKNCDQAEAKK
jgi:hypothetical protein